MSNDDPVAIIAPGESWHAQTLPVSDIEKRERKTSLGRLYRLWSRACRDGIPNENHFDPNYVFGDGDREGFLCVSTVSPNPMDYTIETMRPSVTGGQPISIGALDHSIQHRQLILDLLYCRQHRIPIYQYIEQVFSMAAFPYRRLLLPVENDAGTVSRIYLCYRMLKSDEEQLLAEPPLTTRESVSLLLDCFREGANRPDFVAQERRMLKLEQLPDREVDRDTGGDTTLASLFKYWQDKRHLGRLPLSETFEPSAVFTPEEMRWVSWIDVRAENPFNFVLHNHPGQLFGDFSNTALRDYPHKSQSTCCAFEYDDCKRTQQPAYHEVNQRIGGYHRQYVRVLLPTADRAGKVTKLFYATRYLNTPVMV